jgi:hypothetical protein
MEHPITPPPELVQQWKGTAPHPSNETEHYHYITLCAAQWGADQELEACCEALHQRDCAYLLPSQLRAARRPKPPSLKEQALEELEQLRGDANSMGMGFDAPAIRRALEALPND